jgi:hypothetical protein
MYSWLHPELARHMITNDSLLRYNCLPHPVFSDTIKAGFLSVHRNNYGQVFCLQYEWSRVHPMEKKSDAHEALSVVFKCDEFPPRVIVDNIKEHVFGKFSKKCHSADCYLVTTAS